MLIHQYFAELQRQMHDFPFLASAELTFDERTPHIGLLKGQLTLHDGSVLTITEFVDAEQEGRVRIIVSLDAIQIAPRRRADQATHTTSIHTE